MNSLLSTLVACLLIGVALPAHAGFLYGINLGANPNADTENLYRVDLDDNSVTAVGPDNDIFQGIQSMAYNRNAHVLYGYDIVNDDLVVIDPDTAAIVNTVNISGIADSDINVFALAYDPNSGTLWGINGALNLLPTRSLVSIAPLTGAVTTIGTGFDFVTDDGNNADEPNVTSIDFDPNNNTLYGVGTNTDVLYRIDTTTGKLITIGDVTGGFNGSLGLGYDYDNDVLYGFEDNPDQVITIDTTTAAGSATGITFPSGTNLRSLTYAGSASGNLFELTITEANPGLTFTWPSKAGVVYDLLYDDGNFGVSSPDSWQVYLNHSEIAPNPPENTLTVPRPPAVRGFFVVRQRPPAPGIPANLLPVSGNGQVTLRWDDNTQPNFLEFRIKRSTSPGGPYTQLGTSITGLFTDSTVSNETTYYYIVTSANTDGFESDASAEVEATPSASGGPLIKVFLLGGQSNMRGLGPVATDLPAALQSPQNDLLFYYDSAQTSALPPNALTTLQTGGGNEFGPEITFGRAVADAYPDENFALLKYAANGTDIQDAWDPATGPTYSAFRTTVANGIAALEQAGWSVQIVGMLWTQGERDAKQGYEAGYQTNLAEFIADIRTRYGTNLPFFVSQLSLLQTGMPEAAVATIRQAQANVAAADPDTYLIGTDTFDTGGTIHFNSAGMIALGEAFADSYIQSQTVSP